MGVGTAGAEAVAPAPLKCCALIWMYCCSSGWAWLSSKMAFTGQTGSQAPQSMQSSGLMKRCWASAKPASSLRGWMQSTGQTSTQSADFVPMHLEVMTRVMRRTRRLFGAQDDDGG